MLDQGDHTVKGPEFVRMWQRYEVRSIGYGVKTLRHPEAGVMTLSHEGLTLNRSRDQRLVVYMAPAGTADHDAMRLLDIAATSIEPGTSIETRFSR